MLDLLATILAAGAANYIGLVIAIVLTVIVVNDAKKSGRNAVGWGILTFLTSIIGLIIYFVTKKK